MENYIQQNEGAFLIKRSSLIGLASYTNEYLQCGFYLQNIVSYNVCRLWSRYFLFTLGFDSLDRMRPGKSFQLKMMP
jgi:hypothetical protein